LNFWDFTVFGEQQLQTKNLHSLEPYENREIFHWKTQFALRWCVF
jgi:hypothetical protein